MFLMSNFYSLIGFYYLISILIVKRSRFKKLLKCQMLAKFVPTYAKLEKKKKLLFCVLFFKK